MAQTEKDSFENIVKDHGKFLSVTTTGLSMKKKKQLNKATLQLFFDINQKKDNFHKTHQQSLF